MNTVIAYSRYGGPQGLSLSFAAAAAVVTVGEAAFRVLRHLGLKAGQTLLILGAGGSVGTIAVQLAAARGITVVGTAAEGDRGRLAGRARRGESTRYSTRPGPACWPTPSRWRATPPASSRSPTTTRPPATCAS